MTTRVISVIAPCRNERAHILAFCDAVQAQRLPAGFELEVLVADGMSDDGTRELLAQRCLRDPRFAIVDNPGRIVSAGLNRCIERARGDLVARMDIHTEYASDYLAECVAALERTRADNVGGPWVARGASGWQAAIAAAFQSRYVVGGARSRDIAYEGPVDTVYLGCWPRASFERFGGFDEDLVRNQDDEHNLRMNRAGALVWQSARIHSVYHPRGSLAQLFAQQRQYGYWRPFVMRKHGQSASVRQLVPGAFVAALALCTVAALAWPASGVALAALVLLYAAYVGVASLDIARRGGASMLLRAPAVIAAYHFGYGLGSLRGVFDLLWRGRPAAAFGRLTR
ncbi:MAG TPA: glycosyltransferase family 2 protein [Burkholderiaceae bacterium]|jgi:glycosyltransferase involved in cell wall biosynthesis|nr:glycosyltransferase family 2 protein [Burkholderiaceae bacterium]